MRLSCPSYIIAGTYLENIAWLDRYAEIENIELLFYFFDEETEQLFLKEKTAIADYRAKGRFRFSVHLPDIVMPQHQRVLKLTADLAEQYVVHPPPKNVVQTAAMIQHWQQRYPDKRFVVENLIDRDHAALAGALPACGLCCDTGHLLINGHDPADFVRSHWPRIGEIHLHGVTAGRDHCGFDRKSDWFQRLAPLLHGFDGILNIEVFNEKNLTTILDVLRHYGLID